jgi:fatty-acyl-CoA synthase
MALRLCESASSAYAYPLLIKQLLITPLAVNPNQEIVYRGQVRLTYRQMRERVSRLANVLGGLDIEPGSTVAIMDWDSHRYLEAFFAVPMMGAVLMTANIRLSQEQLRYTIEHSRAEVLVAHVDFAPQVQRLLEEAGTRVRHVVWIADGGSVPDLPGAPVAGEYEALLAEASSEHAFEDFDENAMATSFYTTGTTGLPKAVAFSHRQLVLLTLSVMGAWASSAQGQSFRQGDVYMPITPMFHVHAWGLPFVATLLGVKQVYPGRYDPELLLKLRREEGVTYSHCVPTLLDMLLRAPSSGSTDLRGWKITVGGAALPLGLARNAMDRGMDVFCGYGMSETCAGTLLVRLKPSLGQLDEDTELNLRRKAGLPLPLVDLRVVDERMHDAPHDDETLGEVVMRAPWAVQGYPGMPEASEALWQGGWLHTQDLARMDAEGYVTVCDRLKDVIKSGGEWISSLAVESAISEVVGVAEVAVIGLPDAKWGERPLAVVSAKPGHATQALQVRITAHLQELVDRGAMSRFALPQRVEFVPAVLKTSVGKIDKKALRAQYAPVQS